MAQDAPRPCELWDGPENANKVGFSIAQRNGQRRDAHAGLRRRNQAEHAVASSDERRIRSNLAEPDGYPVLAEILAEADQGANSKLLDRAWCAMLRDVGLAGVDRPDRIRNLPPDQNFIIRVARAQRNVCFAFGQVDIAVAENELNLQVGVASVEALK